MPRAVAAAAVAKRFRLLKGSINVRQLDAGVGGAMYSSLPSMIGPNDQLPARRLGVSS